MIRLLAGDCRDVLATLPAESVHCVVTSPPYYGLRDYGTAQWDGGDAQCDHGQNYRKRRNEQRDGDCGDGGIRRSERDPQTAVCKCGATRIDAQIGLEATPDAYLATMVQVFREVRRVMRPDATAWINMGDGFRDKQLLLMPARLALALQADGWWVRSDIIWHKPNPMPESCTDRPTSAHEHVFLLTKSGAATFWTHRDHAGTGTRPEPDYRWMHHKTGEERDTAPDGWDEDEPTRKLWRRINLWRGHDYFYDAEGTKEAVTGNQHAGRSDGGIPEPRGGGVDTGGARQSMPGGLVTSRNMRNVWTLATAPYAEAHFATYPPALAERCIRAGTSERGCCGQCGAPWVRETSVSYTDAGNGNNNMKRKGGGDPVAAMSARPYEVRKLKDVETTGWSPSCTHDAPVVPATVLDPFGGAGTTGLVADRLQRDAIMIELNPAYTEMAMARCRADAPLFSDWGPVPEPPEEQRQRELFQEPLAAD